MVYYFDMDGVLCNFHKEPYKYVNAINREWIANLDPFVDNIATVKRLIAEGAMVYILTKRQVKAQSKEKSIGLLNICLRFLCNSLSVL